MLTALVLTHIILASGSGGGGFANSTVTIYYIIGILAALGGIVIGGWKIYGRQKLKWTEEGITRQRQAQITEENSTVLKANTNAIEGLSAKMEGFISVATANMNGMSHRIERLERYIPPHRDKSGDLD